MCAEKACSIKYPLSTEDCWLTRLTRGILPWCAPRNTLPTIKKPPHFFFILTCMETIHSFFLCTFGECCHVDISSLPAPLFPHRPHFVFFYPCTSLITFITSSHMFGIFQTMYTFASYSEFWILFALVLLTASILPSRDEISKFIMSLMQGVTDTEKCI